jgi:hypothetical protein
LTGRSALAILPGDLWARWAGKEPPLKLQHAATAKENDLRSAVAVMTSSRQPRIFAETEMKSVKYHPICAEMEMKKRRKHHATFAEMEMKKWRKHHATFAEMEMKKWRKHHPTFAEAERKNLKHLPPTFAETETAR